MRCMKLEGSENEEEMPARKLNDRLEGERHFPGQVLMRHFSCIGSD